MQRVEIVVACSDYLIDVIVEGQRRVEHEAKYLQFGHLLLVSLANKVHQKSTFSLQKLKNVLRKEPLTILWRGTPLPKSHPMAPCPPFHIHKLGWYGIYPG